MQYGSQIVVPVSGGWDSAITWLFVAGILHDGCWSYQNDEAIAVFTDPGREHPLTYAMLDTLDAITGRPIIRLRGPTWEHALNANSWFIPYWRARWCTPTFKIRPFEKWVGDTEIASYIGLRADEEERTGYLGDRGAKITPRYILREMGITHEDRERLGREVGLPPSGPWSCDCCPLRPYILWVKMVEEFPERAEWCAWVEAKKEEHHGGGFGWCRGFKIRELIDNPQLRSDIRRRWYARNVSGDQLPLWDELDEDERPCLLCQVK